MDNKEDKIIIKKTGLPGVNLAMMDFGMTSSVKIKRTKVTRSIFKDKNKTYISTREKLEVNDIFQTGKIKLKYRVLKVERLSDYHWFTYQIKRIDNNLTTSLDIDNSSINDTVFIINRKTFEEMFLEYPHTSSKETNNKQSVPKVICEIPEKIKQEILVESKCKNSKITLKNTNNQELSFINVESGTNAVMTAPNATLYNSNNSFTTQIPSGEAFILPDTVYEVFVNGVLNQSVSLVTLENQIINITA